MSVPRDDFNVIKCLPVSDASFVLLIVNEFSFKKNFYDLADRTCKHFFPESSGRTMYCSNFRNGSLKGGFFFFFIKFLLY